MANILDDSAIHKETPSPSPGVFVAGHFKEQPGYLVHRSGGTRDWLLTYTLAGTGAFQINQTTYTVQEGDIAMLTPGTPHHYYTPQDTVWEFMWVHFIPSPSWSSLLRLPQAAKGLLFVQLELKRIRERIAAAFQRLLQDSLETEAGTLRMQLSMNALEEMVLLLAQANGSGNNRVLDPRVTQVMDLLNLQMSEPHTIESLAAKVALSPSRLSHLFKEQIGESIMETLQKIRLRHAARLLEYTTRQISDIAGDVGYRDPYYFTKLFTGLYGKSPTKYRTNLHKRG